MFCLQISQLNTLIGLLLGDLTVGDRQKIMTICTIDVHSRDVVAKMILMKIESSSAFQWQSQLRHRLDDKNGIIAIFPSVEISFRFIAEGCDICILNKYFGGGKLLE